MSEIGNRIDRDLTKALKAGDPATVSVLRMGKSALKNKEIELGRPLADDDVMTVLQREIKQRRDSIAQFERGGRPELAEQEQREIEILQTYLPAQLSDTELQKIVDAVIAETRASSMAQMGQVIGAVMSRAGGQADGSRVSAAVRAQLQD